MPVQINSDASAWRELSYFLFEKAAGTRFFVTATNSSAVSTCRISSNRSFFAFVIGTYLDISLLYGSAQWQVKNWNVYCRERKGFLVSKVGHMSRTTSMRLP